ncbi:MAG: hypothetical protein Q8O40_05805 [Chloroflexota bacterium]|nr:hypothetical protein [Chloroflexota bacterium]
MARRDRVLAALATVPETRLRLIDLSWELVDREGRMDHDKVVERQPEVNLAVAEAEAYVQATRSAVEALRGIQARSAG